MNKVKIYNYHKLDVIDVINAIEWAKENFDYYDGEISPLWNKYVQREFARLNAERNSIRADLCRTLGYIVADKQLQEDIDIEFLSDEDVVEITN